MIDGGAVKESLSKPLGGLSLKHKGMIKHATPHTLLPHLFCRHGF